jgi:hypothetical protein
VPTELQVEQPEFVGSPSPYRNRLTATLLFLSGLGLWGSAAIGAGALLFGGKGDAAITQLADLFMIAGPAASGGAVLLVLYVIIHQPWRAGRGSLAFVLQIPFALFVLLIVVAFELDAHR